MLFPDLFPRQFDKDDAQCLNTVAPLVRGFAEEGRKSKGNRKPRYGIASVGWRFVFAILILAVFAEPNRANAEIVYDSNITPNTAYFSDAGNSNQRIFDEFTVDPSGPSSVNFAAWTGVYASRNVVPDDFTIQFWDNSGNDPGNLLTSINVGAVSRVQNGTLVLGGSATWDIYEYQVEFSHFDLTPNETYWVSVVNNTGEGWAWMTDTTQGQIAYRTSPTGPFFNTTSTMQIRLESMPEPGSIVLFAICVIPSLRRRRYDSDPTSTARSVPVS